MQSTAGHFCSRGLDENIRRNTYIHTLQLNMQNSSILPFSHCCSHAISLSISPCADVLCSADIFSIFPPTVPSLTHTHLLLMNEWEKTLISIKCCFSFSVPLKQSLLFSPCSFSPSSSPTRTHARTHALVGD